MEWDQPAGFHQEAAFPEMSAKNFGSVSSSSGWSSPPSPSSSQSHRHLRPVSKSSPSPSRWRPELRRNHRERCRQRRLHVCPERRLQVYRRCLRHQPEGSCSLRTAVGSIMTHGASTRRRKNSPPRDWVHPSPQQHKLRFGRLVDGFKAVNSREFVESSPLRDRVHPSPPQHKLRFGTPCQTAGNSWRDNSQG